MPTAAELGPLLELQARTNRVGVETPYGSQNYRTNPDGTTTLVTDVGADGQNMINRAGGLAMTDSARMDEHPQLNALAGALSGRVGNRLGVGGGGGPMNLSNTSAPAAAKPQASKPAPAPQGLPNAPPGQNPYDEPPGRY